ncbi:MAG: CcmD family protein [Owenweeksia sp.]
MTKIKNQFLLLVTLLISYGLQAQGNDVEMADIMRSNGKIYVVVAVLAIVFIGIVIYLISIDRKLNKLEKNQ